MSASSAVRAKLIGTAGVTALCGTRVYAITAPDGATDAHVIMQQIGSDPASVHSGASGISHRMFQFACFAGSYEAATALRDAVIAALDGEALSNGDVPTLQDERDFDKEDGANLYRADCDFLV
jgi:hypothetical protein